MSTQLSVMDTRYGFTPEQVEVIKATIAPGATNEELALFLMVCQKKGLDPFSRQIYLSERRSFDPDTQQWIVKKSPETTIDGFRCIAERSGKYEGQLGPFWCGEDGEWRDVWLGKNMPSAAKVGILRKDFKEPVWGIALFEEYVQTKKDGTPNKMWQKMGANQLAKCSESLALRKAFPADLSGMYTREEMAQSTKDSEENSKEAQQEVAQRRIADLTANKQERAMELGKVLNTPPATPTEEDRSWGRGEVTKLSPSPETIIELANSLDQTPEPPLMVPEVKKPAKKEKAPSAMTEAAKKRWLQAKLQLRAVRQDKDAFYYAALSPYPHCTAIHTKEEAEAIWRVLQSGLVPQGPPKHDLTLEQELQRHQREHPKFMDKLGAYGFSSISEIIERASGAELGLLLAELRQR